MSETRDFWISDEQAQQIESAENFLRGLGMFERRLPDDIKRAVLGAMTELEKLNAKIQEQQL